MATGTRALEFQSEPAPLEPPAPALREPQAAVELAVPAEPAPLLELLAAEPAAPVSSVPAPNCTQ